MGWFDAVSEEARAHTEVLNSPHKAKLSHELIASAAAYEAAKAYEKHEQTSGKPQSHAKAKELIAGFAGAFVDRIAETKGLDYIDREKVKLHAQQKAEQKLDKEN